MAKNLLQASQVYSHRPIVLEEAPDAWEVASGIADTFFDPDATRVDRELDLQEEEIQEGKRQFDVGANLERERNSIMAQDVKGRQKIAKMDSERRKLDDARDDYFRYGAKLPPNQRIALANQYGLSDLAEQAESEKVRSDDAMAEINSIVKSVSTGEATPDTISNILDKHSVTIGEMSTWNSNYLDKINRDLEGYAAKETLLSLRDTIGEEGLVNLGINTSKWTGASATQARNYLASLPLSIKTVRDLKADDISNIKDMAEIVTESISKMEEFGLTETQQYRDAVKMQTGIIDKYSTLIGFGEDKAETKDERIAREQKEHDARFTTVSTEEVGDIEKLERDKEYYVTYTDNRGVQRKSKMTGQKAEEQITSYGNKIKSTEEMVDIIDKDGGVPKIKVNAKVKHLETGKILKFIGLAKGKRRTDTMAFEDSSGKTTWFTKKNIYDVPFGYPSVEEDKAFEVRYAQKIPQEVEEATGGGFWLKGMFETTRAAQRKVLEERKAKAEARKKKLGMQKGGMVGDTTEARLDEIDKILGPVPNEAAMG